MTQMNYLILDFSQEEDNKKKEDATFNKVMNKSSMNYNHRILHII